jgi:uncharacterized protein involved in exopolysaccharide biosynthesis/Mrp family chromosome partitioning ATPase
MTNSLGLPEIVRAAMMRRRLILGISTALFAFVAAAVFLVRPSYQADALVEVAGPRRAVPGSEGTTSAGIEAEALLATVNTEAARLGSELIARSTYAQLGDAYTSAREKGGLLAYLRRSLGSLCKADRDPAWFQFQVCGHGPLEAATPKSDATAFRNFYRALAVDPVRGSRLIRVMASAPDPALAARIANTLVQVYIQVRADETTQQDTQFIRWLEERITEMDKRVTQSDQAVAEYRGATNLIEMSRDSDAVPRTAVTAQLSSLLNDLASATAARAQAEVRLARMRELKMSPQRTLNSTEVIGSELIRDLSDREAVARQHMLDLRSAYGEGHPSVRAAETVANELRSRINSEASRVLEGATQDYERASAVVERLKVEIAKQQSRAASEQIDEVRLHDLERRARVDSDLHAAFMRFTQEAIERSTWHESPVQIVAKAIAPERPSFPNKRLLLPLGLIGSFSVAVLVAVILETRRCSMSFVDPTDLEETTGLRVQGAIPSVRNPSSLPSPDDFALAVEEIALRLVRRSARGANTAQDRSCQVFATTSCSQGEGKSAFSLALARWMVKHGKATLLIDADMRRPAILRDSAGTKLVSTATGPAWAPKLPLRVETKTNLIILSLDEVEADAIALIGGFEEVLQAFQSLFDVIIVDTPPILAVPDALNVSPYVDQLLFIVQWAATRRRSLLYALGRLGAEERARTRLVFNKVETKSYRRYGAPGADRYRGYSGYTLVQRPSPQQPKPSAAG